jgi:hypothetical protein
VVAGLVLERRPEEGLAAPPDEQQVRVALPRYSPCIGAILAAVVDSTCLEALEALHVGASPSASVSGMAASSPWIWR